MIMDLLDHFSANTANFDNWEQQLILLKKTYKLIENYTRVLINMKLKGTGVIPFQSHPYGRFSDDFFSGLHEIFYHRASKIEMRKTFEKVWQRDKTFHEFMHAKMILNPVLRTK